jgi:predicted AAA+ superfamily ATPase
LENFVVVEMMTQIAWSRVRPRVFHVRSQTGREVDLALEDRSGRMVGIEVKSGLSVSSGDFDGLRWLAAQTGEKFVRGIVLYEGNEQVAFGKNMWAVPVRAL